MNVPVIAPASDDVRPCSSDWQRFLSPYRVDHNQVRALCKGNKRQGRPPCPFIGWCIKEREETQRLHGRANIEGTWHGELFVGGEISDEGKRPWVRKST